MESRHLTPAATRWRVAGVSAILVAGLVVLRLGLWTDRPEIDPSAASSLPPTTAPNDRRITPQMAAELAALETREQAATEGIWAPEMLADAAGRVIEGFWDSLNASARKLEIAAAFDVGEITLPSWDDPRSAPFGVQDFLPRPPQRVLGRDGWRDLVETAATAGWRLAQCEFRHVRFEPETANSPRQSRFRFAAHLTNAVTADRAVLEGPLVIRWRAGDSPAAPMTLQSVDARDVGLRQRSGPPPFVPTLVEAIEPVHNALAIDPLILHDLDGDGLAEILLPARNLVYRRQSGEQWTGRPLFQHAPLPLYAAVLGDFDGDGFPDLLCEKYEGLMLLKGSAAGTFDAPPRRVWQPPPEVRYPMVLTCGDVDHDGDLDVYLAQYRDPYEDGAIPAPFYAANNGHPAFLLRNDGTGQFSDITDAAGLGPVRRRRNYSASFVDLDGDRHLDLAIVSDFAGLDLLHNDGQGHFTEVTSRQVREPHAFGMAHAFADFNVDGRLDLLVMGMVSPTVERLDHLGLVRPGLDGEPAMRTRMAHGNRLYLGQPDHTLIEGPLSASIANSGWSWGCGVGDFDNDGFPDVYVANGLESRASVREYEGEYWLHDRFVGTADDNPAALLYFKTKIARTRGRGQSYGGYEKNRLYLNQAGQSFLELGHLFGVALEQDSRNVVVDDLDGDGRPDIVVISYEGWPRERHVLRVFHNALATPHHWIGFRLVGRPGEVPPVGARVDLEIGGRRAIQVVVTGDSYRSQHPPNVHFGLGPHPVVDRVVIEWPDGTPTVIEHPQIDRYHAVQERPASGDRRSATKR